jgi:hypothetical protein
MAVTITTEFYETDTPAWHDLSKVVFTSPNLDSPNTAGTRSHILPGELPLATWYEDTSNMYRIFDNQQETTTSGYVSSAPGPGAEFHAYNSIKFELTSGENYDNRLTAWDDVTHSSIENYLIDSNRVKVSAVAYYYNLGGGTEDDPDTIVEVEAPQYNIILKGNTTVSGQGDAYYGDFNMTYKTGYDGGDLILFRPMLDNIDGSVPFGVHDFVITLHYSFT